MARVLCVGIATLDIVNEVIHYPAEDDEVRIVGQNKQRGGNAANTAVVLSQLGHQSYWAGTLVNETDCQIILQDFDRYQVNYEFCQFLAQGKVPTSYILLSQKTGSRTISHFRDLPEYTCKAFQKINLQAFEWLHFEGRNVAQTLKMISYAKQQVPDIKISVEIEKPRDNIESLVNPADIIIFSRHYALTQGFNSAEEFCRHKGSQYVDKAIFCAWGSAGAAAFVRQEYYWQDALQVNAVDTLAAGDVFNAALINQQINNQDIKQSLGYSCQLAAQACTHRGINIK